MEGCLDSHYFLCRGVRTVLPFGLSMANWCHQEFLNIGVECIILELNDQSTDGWYITVDFLYFPLVIDTTPTDSSPIHTLNTSLMLPKSLNLRLSSACHYSFRISHRPPHPTNLSLRAKAFVVSIPLIVLTMAEQQLFFLLQGCRKGKARGEHRRPGCSGSGSDSNSCSDGGDATPMPSPTNSVFLDQKLGSGDDETTAEMDADTIGKHAHGDPVPDNDTADTADASGFDSGGAPCGWDRGAGSGDGYTRVSTLIKRFNARWLLLLMGVSVREEGLKECRLSHPAMLLFAHVSTLDAMIILGTFPRAMCAVVKVNNTKGDYKGGGRWRERRQEGSIRIWESSWGAPGREMRVSRGERE